MYFMVFVFGVLYLFSWKINEAVSFKFYVET